MSAASRKSRDEAVDFWSVLHLVREQAFVIAACAVAGLVAAGVFVWTREPVYTSQAVLEVAQDNEALADFSKRGNSDLNSASLLKTIEQTVVSQAVLLRVIETQQLAKDPAFAPPREEGGYTEAELIELLQRRLNVGLVRGTRLILLSASDHDPVRAQRLAQGVVDEFFAQKLQAGREGNDSARQYLLAEATRVKDDLTASEERLQQYREKYNAVSLADRHNLVVGRLSDISAQLSQARVQRLSMETERSQVDLLLKTGPEALLNMRGIAALPEVIELLKQLNALTAEVGTLAQRYREKHPRMIEVSRQLKETQETLRTTLQRAGEAIIQSHRTAQGNEEMLQREFDQQEKLALELSRVSIPYRALEREAESNQALYQQVLARLKEAGVNQGLITVGNVEGSRIRITQKPLVPVRPSDMSKKILLAFGLFAGCGIGLVLAILRRALDNSLPSVDVAEAYLEIPSLAVVHQSEIKDLRHEPVVNAHPATIEAEAFRSLRTSLSLLKSGEASRVVMFTSAMQGEGKSFCSMNHAASLAQQGFRTLLVDGDLRRAWLRKELAPASEKPGLIECLNAPDLLADAVSTTETTNLFVLGDLRGSTKGVELLSSPNLRVFIERCREQFDRVVIDTAPVTAVSDALYFARHIETICLVVHARSTPRRTVRRACKLLETATGRLPSGIVLNHVNRGRSGSYYYYSNSESYVDNKGGARGPLGLIRSWSNSLAASVSSRRI